MTERLERVQLIGGPLFGRIVGLWATNGLLPLMVKATLRGYTYPGEYVYETYNHPLPIYVWQQTTPQK